MTAGTVRTPTLVFSGIRRRWKLDTGIGRTGFTQVPCSFNLDGNEAKQEHESTQDADCGVQLTDIERRHF